MKRVKNEFEFWSALTPLKEKLNLILFYLQSHELWLLNGCWMVVRVSAFTLVGLNWLPPEQMLLIEEDTLGFDRGKGQKSYPEKRLFAADFPQTH